MPDSTRLMLIHAAERQLGKPWGSIPASVTLLFKENGSRAEYDAMNTARGDRLAALVMAEVLENRGRFLSDIADGIWAISEQTFWGSTAHLGLQQAGVGLPDVEEPVVELFAGEAAEPLPGDVWFPDLQLMAARATPASTRGLYVAAWGLNNGKSHNHNDVGNFIVYGDGEPVLIDVGVGTYTAQTFSARRYEIWTMQSAYHNLPTINGVMEMDGKPYHATDVAFAPSSDAVQWSADIARAYPETAYVRSWKRTVTLNRRANDVEIVDAYDLERVTRPVRSSLMTPLRVDVATPGVVRLAANGRSYMIRYDAQQFRASAEGIPINDARLHPVWGDRITRIVLSGTATATHGEYRVVVNESP